MVSLRARYALLSFGILVFAGCSSNGAGGGGGVDPNDPRHQNDNKPPTSNSDPTAPGATPTGPGGNGMIAPPPPTRVDTGGNTIPDTGPGPATAACSRANDRPFSVYDFPCTDSMLVVDAKVSIHSELRTMDNKVPGAMVVDPDLDVAAVVISKAPSSGVRSAAQQRDADQQRVLSALGTLTGPRSRTFANFEGFTADQSHYSIVLRQPTTARALAAQLASALLGGAALTGAAPSAGTAGGKAFVDLLTVYRSSTRVVMLAAVAVQDTLGDAAEVRLDELSDGTNLARHDSFTRHVCDVFNGKSNNKVDILWVMDDSGSMRDDQEQVRAAGQAMADVLASGGVDYRLAVARMYAPDRTSTQRGDLVAPGWTNDVNVFKQIIVVGASGGWEYGLKTGILAIDRMLPKTPAGTAPSPSKLRGDANLVVVHMSDERDQDVQDAACGGVMNHENDQTFCNDPSGQSVVDNYIHQYQARDAVTFAIVGDEPHGCTETGSMQTSEPGQGYVEVANAVGGKFGSLCGDMHQNVIDVARVATGVSSNFPLSHIPASSTIKIAAGDANTARQVTRSRTNGWDYDPSTNRIIFYGTGRPMKGEDVVIGYRRIDWAHNGSRPPDACDLCAGGTACDPTLDTAYCAPICGDVICADGMTCQPDSASCGTPTTPVMNPPPTPSTTCGSMTCANGQVCNSTTNSCVAPCEMTGCAGTEICSPTLHICQPLGV
jgi:hypothetical protein